MSETYQRDIVMATLQVHHAMLYPWNLTPCSQIVAHSEMLVQSDKGPLALSAVKLVITRKTVGTIQLMPTLPTGAVCELVVDSKVVVFVAVRHHSTAVAIYTMPKRTLKRVKSLTTTCTTLTPTTSKTHLNQNQQKTEQRGCTPRPKNCKSNTQCNLCGEWMVVGKDCC